MEKLIEDIIDVILDDVNCHHEVDHDEDGDHISAEYNLNNEIKVKGMIKDLLQEKANKDWDNARDAYGGERKGE